MTSEETAQRPQAKTTLETEDKPQEQSQFKVYNPPSGNSSSRPIDLPDDYFEFTTTELKAAFNSQRKLRESLMNAPLKTQAMRESEEKTRLQRWPNTTIRIKFPDQTMLEKAFPSTDKIKAVYAFVRASLREDMKPNKFVLYQTPPRREFKVSDPTVRNLTLAQLTLTPSSILYLSFLEATFNDPSIRAPLSGEILQMAQDLPPPPKPETTNPVAPNEIKGKATSSPSGEKKIPKWLKLSKK